MEAVEAAGFFRDGGKGGWGIVGLRGKTAGRSSKEEPAKLILSSPSLRTSPSGNLPSLSPVELDCKHRPNQGRATTWFPVSVGLPNAPFSISVILPLPPQLSLSLGLPRIPHLFHAPGHV